MLVINPETANHLAGTLIVVDMVDINLIVVATNQKVEFHVLEITLATGANERAIKNVNVEQSNVKFALERRVLTSMAQPMLSTLTLLNPGFPQTCNSHSTLLLSLARMPLVPFPGMGKRLPIQLLLRTLLSIKIPTPLLSRHTFYLLVLH